MSEHIRNPCLITVGVTSADRACPHRRQAELALRVLGTDPQADQATQDALQCRGIHAERMRQCRCGVVAMLELVGDAELRGDVQHLSSLRAVRRLEQGGLGLWHEFVWTP
jgi:hypothetical protein